MKAPKNQRLRAARHPTVSTAGCADTEESTAAPTDTIQYSSRQAANGGHRRGAAVATRLVSDHRAQDGGSRC